MAQSHVDWLNRPDRDHWHLALSWRGFRDLPGLGVDFDRAGGAVRLRAAPLVPWSLPVHDPVWVLHGSHYRQSCSGGALFINPYSVRIDFASMGGRIFSSLNRRETGKRSGNQPDRTVHLTACFECYESAEIKASLHQESGPAIVPAQTVVFPPDGPGRRAAALHRPA